MLITRKFPPPNGGNGEERRRFNNVQICPHSANVINFSYCPPATGNPLGACPSNGPLSLQSDGASATTYSAKVFTSSAKLNPRSALITTAFSHPTGTPGPHYTFRFRRRSELAITDTLLKLIAAAAIMGLNRMPNQGYKIPAAIGIPRML